MNGKRRSIKRARALVLAHWPVLVFTAFVLAGRSSVADHYIVPSASMEHTLVPGDRVLVDKTAYGLRLPFSDFLLRAGPPPRAGEVVIFDSPEDGTRLIKRVVAVAGDLVELRGGLLRINGEPLSAIDGFAVERFDSRTVRLNLGFGSGPNIPPTRVSRGHVLVLGDSRGNSRDSRYFGSIPVDALYARAARVFFRRNAGFIWQPL